MSLSPLTAIHARMRSERGFTLVEVLVAMVVGLIVSGALFAILEISLKQNARITDRVVAQQLGNTAMTRIIDPLRSGCIAREATPVEAGSTPSKLIFTTAFSEGTTPEPKEVFKEAVTYEAATHKLVSSVQQASSGAWPTYGGWGTAKTSTLLENVYLPGGFPNGPFRYFKYGTASTSTATTGVSALEAFTTVGALNAEEAKKVASVEVGFENLAPDKDARLTRAAQFTDQATFAFSSPNSEATIKAGPCE
jgi:prepilin-type N-terminal cleavage/methylation domain-containing protein